MDTLPIDTSHPAVRDYLALIRLQVLTPLSLLLNIATLLVCALLASPSIAGVAHLYPTAITPKIGIIEAYIFVIWLTQIGYCVLLVGARKPETKATLIKGVGLALPIANLLLCFWAIAWIMKWFLAATICVGLILVVLLYSNTVLLVYHAPDYSSRPFDALLIHAPMRFFLVLPLSILFALSLFITLHMNYKPTPTGPPPNYSAWHAGAGAGVVAGSNVLALLVVVLRRDIVWCIAAVWINVSLWSSRVQPPAGVNITAILFTAILPLALIAAFVYQRFCSGERAGRIRLIGAEGTSSPPNHVNRSNAQEPINNTGPREVDDTWG